MKLSFVLSTSAILAGYGVLSSRLGNLDLRPIPLEDYRENYSCNDQVMGLNDDDMQLYDNNSQPIALNSNQGAFAKWSSWKKKDKYVFKEKFIKYCSGIAECKGLCLDKKKKKICKKYRKELKAKLGITRIKL
ncbi:hypothetical protein AYI69_g1206 [Smittium culicis]|uniref:Uncharacterized protein n=1 Tax=Smittium culicis TaxID=133412 RepID=A0A1R1YR25_9FUNG|nr:hypothetical protein AYI69_g1206 [Smittium culicis]